MSLRRFSSTEIAFVLGVPLAWAVLLLFHPSDGDSLYELATSNTDAWLVVHLGTLIFIPLTAGVLFVVLRHFEGTAALVGRIALAVFAVFYLAFEILVGIGVGLLVQESAPESVVDAYGDSTILTVIETIGSIAWLVAVLGAAVAMFDGRYRTRSIVVLLLFVITAPGIVIHVSPIGPIALVLFAAALWLVVREPAREAAEEPLVAA